jgi:hypothetical protein
MILVKLKRAQCLIRYRVSLSSYQRDSFVEARNLSSLVVTAFQMSAVIGKI